jgi:hypothetical protein
MMFELCVDRARAALAEPEPATDGEVAELVKWLRANSSGIYRPAARAADLLERLAESEPTTSEND